MTPAKLALRALIFASICSLLHAAPPVLDMLRRFGGNGLDQATALAVDGQGNTYVVGNTTSTDFPVTNAFQPTLRGLQDAFVMKFNTNGTILFSTYLGGSRDDVATGVAVDTNGNIFITGYTLSTNFPTANALQSTNAGNNDVFVAKLNPTGSALVYSTYIGGKDFDTPGGIAIDASGNAIVSGYTQSTNFPTANAAQPSFGGIGDAFVFKLNASGGGFVYSTYLGGSGQENRNGSDLGGAVAVDSLGNAYVTGWTYSQNFPVSHALQPTKGDTSNNALTDAFVTKFDAGGAILFSTYLGGFLNDKGRAIAVHPNGRIYITGNTDSDDFPARLASVTGGLTNFAGQGNASLGDAFLTTIDAAGSNLVYSIFIGGAGDEEATSLAVDAAGNATMSGFTDSPNFPLRDAFQSSGNQAFFHSTDAAATWTVSNNGITSASVKAAQFDPFSPLVLYAITGAGISKSTDGGAHWSDAGTGIDVPSLLTAIAVDPVHPGTLFVAGYTGVFKSTDGAQSWTSASLGLPGSFPDIQSLAIDPSTPTTLYVGMTSSGVYKSVDGGNNWASVNSGLTVLRVTALAVDPRNSSIVFAGCNSFNATNLFKSNNGGTNWVRVSGGGYPAGNVVSLAFNPTNSANLFALLNPNFGSSLYQSKDAGLTWSPLLQSASSFHFTAFAIAPTAPATMFLGTDAASGQGVLKSTDAGTNWNTAGLAGDKITALTVNPTNALQILAGVDGGRDAFITTVDPSGTLSFSTYFGGAGADEGHGLAISGGGTIRLVGFTTSPDLPRPAFTGSLAVRPKESGTIPQANNFDAFVANLLRQYGDSADLAVTVSADPPRAGLDDIVTYTIQVANNGTDPAQNIAVHCFLKSASASLSPDFDIVRGDCTGSSGYYLCTIPSLEAGARVLLRMVIQNRSFDPIECTASAFAETTDPNLSNNSAAAAPARKMADLSVAVSVNPIFPRIGDQVTFQVEVTNNGPDEAKDVGIGFDLSDGIMNLTELISQCDGTAGFYSCAAGTLTPGDRITRTFTARVTAGGTIHCRGTAYSGTFDPDLRNNEAHVEASAPAPAFISSLPFAAPPGTQVTFKGNGLSGLTSLMFNGTTAGFQVINDFTVSTIVPNGATTGPISANISTSSIVSPFIFNVLTGSQPVIGTLSANVGSAGSYITITGVNLAGATVQIGGVDAFVDPLLSTGNQLVVRIPANAVTGPIRVTNLAGSSVSPQNFTVTSCPGLSLASTPPNLPNGTAGQDYFTTEPVIIDGVGGQAGTTGFTFTLAGRLPQGLALDQDGSFSHQVRIAGTPREAGTFTFIVTMSDGSGCSVSRTFTLVVDPGPSQQIAVTTSANGGPGSLRDAINRANAKPGSTIFFAIPIYDQAYDPNSRTFTLQPFSPLPPITADGTRIEGGLKDPATGNTADNSINVFIDGSHVTGVANGLVILSERCVVQNLAFAHWTGDGLNTTHSVQLAGLCEFTDNGRNGVYCGGSLATDSIISHNNDGWGAQSVGDLSLNLGGHAVSGQAVAQFCGKGGFSSTRGAVIGANVRVTSCGQQAAAPSEGAGISASTFISITTLECTGNLGSGCIANDVILDGDCELGGNGGDGIHAAAFCQIEDAYIHDNSGFGCIVENGDAFINLGGKRTSCRVWLNHGGGISVLSGTCSAFNVDCSRNYSTGIRCENGDLQACTLDFNDGFGCEFDGGSCAISDTEIVGNTQSGIVCISPFSPFNLTALAAQTSSVNKVSKCFITSNGGDGVYYQQVGPFVVEQSSIYGNNGFALDNIAAQTVIRAQRNWWGAVSGPGGVGPGSGDQVSIAVDFSSWLTAPVALTISAVRPGIGIAPGGQQSFLVVARNWAGSNDALQVTYGDALQWAQFAGAQVPLSNHFTIFSVPLVAPLSTPVGASNSITLTAVSVGNSSLSNAVTVSAGVLSNSIPAIAPLAVTPAGDFLLRVSGNPGATCVIEFSDDLIHWMPLLHRTLQGSSLIIAEPLLFTPHRFYRSLQAPPP